MVLEACILIGRAVGSADAVRGGDRCHQIICPLHVHGGIDRVGMLGIDGRVGHRLIGNLDRVAQAVGDRGYKPFLHRRRKAEVIRSVAVVTAVAVSLEKIEIGNSVPVQVAARGHPIGPRSRDPRMPARQSPSC